MLPEFVERSVPLRLPEGASGGFGTDVVGLPAHHRFLFSFLVGRASRLQEVDVRTGHSRTQKGVRGLLRAGVLSADGSRLGALFTHGLYEISLESLALLRSATKGFGSYSTGLLPLLGGQH